MASGRHAVAFQGEIDRLRGMRQAAIESGKKDKGAAAPEAKVCANCLAPEGQRGITLKACTRCKLTDYCGRACQTAHWKAFHKQFCVTPEERAPRPPASSPAPAAWREEQKPRECAICLDPLASGSLCTLPCSHSFHAACVDGLRKFGIKQVCPMCREELPPGPDKLFEEGARKLFSMNLGGASWGVVLTKAQQQEMNEIIRMWRVAADQGHAGAQGFLGIMYAKGDGVKQDYVEAVRWYRKSAEQGNAGAQCNLGVSFMNGDGVKQNFEEALLWFRKAAAQGDADGKENALLAEEMQRKQKQAALATQSSPKLTCANCGVAEAVGGFAFKPCSRCKAVVYCGKDCQAQHWKKPGGHRAVCKN